MSKKKRILLQSNLCSELIHRDILRKEKIKEEKRSLEEKEADENYAIYGYRYPSEFMKKHKQDYIDGKMHGYRYSEYTSSYYNNSSGDYYSSDYCVIYFYEWSSVHGSQHTYYSFNNFFRYCSDNNIIISDAIKSEMRKMSLIYCTCEPESNNLMLSDSYLNLDNKLKEYETITHRL